MKKFILASFMVIVTSTQIFGWEVMNISTLTNIDLESVMSQEKENTAVEFSEGTILPLKFFLKGDLLTLVGEEREIGQVKVEKTFYVRLKGEDFLFSLDLSTWKSCWDFFTGTASVDLNVDEKIPSITFGAEANHLD
ncbi:MAG: hypothetical protein V4489_10405 [Chlamydiota bacterium]